MSKSFESRREGVIHCERSRENKRKWRQIKQHGKYIDLFSAFAKKIQCERR